MGDREEVKLYGTWYSPASLRVEMALKLKGIPYEYIEEDLDNKSSALLNYNPVHKKIPVLVHNGKPIAESMIIIEYIDETWNNANPILPLDPFDRAMARFWANFLEKAVKKLPKAATCHMEREDCHIELHVLSTCFSQYGVSLVRMCWIEGEDQKAMEEAHRTLKTLDDHIKLGKEKIFTGDGGEFVDMAANIVAHWIDVIQEAVGVELITEAKYPTLCQWSKEYKTRVLVKDFLPPRDALLAFYKARYEIHRASRSQS